MVWSKRSANFSTGNTPHKAAQEEEDFKVAMQQLSAAAEKVRPVVQEKEFSKAKERIDSPALSEILAEQLRDLENNLLSRIERLAAEMEASTRAAFARHFKRIDHQLPSIPTRQTSHQP